jgi:hypothetical protein
MKLPNSLKAAPAMEVYVSSWSKGKSSQEWSIVHGMHDLMILYCVHSELICLIERDEGGWWVEELCDCGLIAKSCSMHPPYDPLSRLAMFLCGL